VVGQAKRNAFLIIKITGLSPEFGFRLILRERVRAFPKVLAEDRRKFERDFAG
jgi:hypothetical protein